MLSIDELKIKFDQLVKRLDEDESKQHYAMSRLKTMYAKIVIRIKDLIEVFMSGDIHWTCGFCEQAQKDIFKEVERLKKLRTQLREVIFKI